MSARAWWVGILLGGIAAPGSGCNLVAGIEPVSGTPQDDFAETCLEVINEERAQQMFTPVARWLDTEACAQDRAEGTTADLCGASSAYSCSRPRDTNKDMLRDCFNGGGFDEADAKVACSFFERTDGTVEIVALFH